MLYSDSEKRNEYLHYAQKLMEYFVRNCQKFYGDIFTVYNIHNLLHLHEDVQYFGCSLNDVSAFKFENHLQMIKKMVKNAKNPIVQVIKSLAVLEKSAGAMGHVHNERITYVSSRKKDWCFLLSNEAFCFVKEKRCDGFILCDVVYQHHMENFFHRPCDSKLINIAYIKDTVLKHRTRRKLVEKKDLKKKVVCLPFKEGFVLFPMLHGIEKH